MKKNLFLIGILAISIISINAQVPTSDLVGYWPFNSNANDESGNGYNGTVYGATLTNDRFGNGNSAYYFDGDDDYIELGDIAELDSALNSNFSFSIWFKTNSQNSQRIISKRVPYRGFEIGTYEGNRFGIFYGGDNYNWSIYPEPLFISDKWNHISVNVDKTNGYIYSYLNGVAVDSILKIDNITGDISNNEPARLGVNKDLHVDFNGDIDDVRIFKRLLKDSEIQQLYNEKMCYDTTHILVYDTITTEIFDTTSVTVYDIIAVTDTLIIDAVLTGIDPPDNINTIKIYPNPAKDHLFINTGDYSRMTDYQLKIVNQLGTVVFETYIEEPLYKVNLSSWSGMGLYFVNIIDSEGIVIDIRKIILK